MLLSLEERQQELRLLPWLRLGFRPFFWLGALFGSLSLLLWSWFWIAPLGWQPYGGWLFWHQHEMLFGFVVAIVVGFLLTAVQNWTGLRGLNGWPLAGLVGLWGLGRFALLMPGWPPALVALVDLSFLPLVAWALARPLVRIRQWRNLPFVLILAGLTVANGLMHWQPSDPAWMRLGSWLAIGLILLIMAILGGRVIPFFTARGLQTEQVKPWPWLEWLSLAGLLLAWAALLVSLWQGRIWSWLGSALLMLALLHGLRLLRWYRAGIWRLGLLWPLHLSYGCIALGLAALGAWQLGWVGLASPGLHLLTVGGMGLMILAMMARVALGHTGRRLEVSVWMIPAFVALVLALLCRALLPLFWPGASHLWVYVGSSLFWLLGYGIFLLIYSPILFQPRADGQPG